MHEKSANVLVSRVYLPDHAWPYQSPQFQPTLARAENRLLHVVQVTGLTLYWKLLTWALCVSEKCNGSPNDSHAQPKCSQPSPRDLEC